jgi:hypothetical protein
MYSCRIVYVPQMNPCRAPCDPCRRQACIVLLVNPLMLVLPSVMPGMGQWHGHASYPSQSCPAICTFLCYFTLSFSVITQPKPEPSYAGAIVGAVIGVLACTGAGVGGFFAYKHIMASKASMPVAARKISVKEAEASEADDGSQTDRRPRSVTSIQTTVNHE